MTSARAGGNLPEGAEGSPNSEPPSGLPEDLAAHESRILSMAAGAESADRLVVALLDRPGPREYRGWLAARCASATSVSDDVRIRLVEALVEALPSVWAADALLMLGEEALRRALSSRDSYVRPRVAAGLARLGHLLLSQVSLLAAACQDREDDVHRVARALLDELVSTQADAADALVGALDSPDARAVQFELSRLARTDSGILQRVVCALGDERPQARSGAQSVLFRAGSADSAGLSSLLRRALDGHCRPLDGDLVWELLRRCEGHHAADRPADEHDSDLLDGERRGGSDDEDAGT